MEYLSVGMLSLYVAVGTLTFAMISKVIDHINDGLKRKVELRGDFLKHSFLCLMSHTMVDKFAEEQGRDAPFYEPLFPVKIREFESFSYCGHLLEVMAAEKMFFNKWKCPFSKSELQGFGKTYDQLKDLKSSDSA